jgi:hypothetical protein
MPVILVRFTSNLNFLNGFSTKFSNIRFHENVCSGSRAVTSGQTDRMNQFCERANNSQFHNLILTCTWPDGLLRKKKEAEEKVLVKDTSNATLMIIFFQLW